ncbi:MAG: hypothetical protein HC838_14770 [Spirulinaceae cyanobacterium RM2_2_10]|nr:hypothetical protein [Spirulinaceae cyanobacterium RM2_2_10]
MQLFDRVRLGLAVSVAKVATAVVRRLKRGAGSVLPGRSPANVRCKRND